MLEATQLALAFDLATTMEMWRGWTGPLTCQREREVVCCVKCNLLNHADSKTFVGPCLLREGRSARCMSIGPVEFALGILVMRHMKSTNTQQTNTLHGVDFVPGIMISSFYLSLALFSLFSAYQCPVRHAWLVSYTGRIPTGRV